MMRTGMWMAAAVAAVTLAAGGASAETITFEDGAGFFSNVVSDGFDATGAWNEAGFQVGFTAQNVYVLDDISDLSASALPSLVDDCSGCPGGVWNTSLTFSRPDGLTFDLDQVEVLSSSSSWRGDAAFIPFGADGIPDFSNSITESFDLVFPDISIAGTRSDGSTVSAGFESYSQAKSWVGPVTGSVVVNDGVLSGEELRAPPFTDLVSLSFGVGGFSSEWLPQSLAVGDLDRIFDLAPSDCVSTCAVEGLGLFQFETSPFNSFNYLAGVSFGDVTLTLADTPAPVPLPASVWLFGAALAGLGLASRRP